MTYQQTPRWYAAMVSAYGIRCADDKSVAVRLWRDRMMEALRYGESG